MQRGREACTVIDLGEVAWDDCEKPRKFAISAGVGLDALVCKKALTSKLKVFLNKLHLGKLTYLLITVQSLFSHADDGGCGASGRDPGAEVRPHHLYRGDEL